MTVWLGSGLVAAGVVVAAITLLPPRVPRARGLPRRGFLDHGAFQGFTERAVEAAAGMLSRAHESGLGRWLERAGIDLRPGEFMVVVAAATVVAYLLTAVAAGVTAGLVAAILTMVVAKGVVDMMARRRQKEFADQLADTLLLMAGTLRSGYGTAQAIDAVGRSADAPTSEEFRRLVVETRLGRNFTEAMGAMAARMRSEDMEWVVEAFEIHAEVGGDLADVLDTVAETIHERNQVRNRIKVLSAEGILSAAVLFALPIGVAVILGFTNPGYLGAFYDTGQGKLMLAAGAVLQALGGVWLRYLVKPRF